MNTNAPIAGASLVRADDDRYFILKAGNYYQASIAFGQSGTVTATANDMTSPLTAADFSSPPTAVAQTPTVDPATDTVAFQDSSGTTINASATRLLQRGNGTYAIEVDTGGGNFRYYDAALTMTDDGSTRIMTAKALSSTYQAFTDLPSVGGRFNRDPEPSQRNDQLHRSNWRDLRQCDGPRRQRQLRVEPTAIHENRHVRDRAGWVAVHPDCQWQRGCADLLPAVVHRADRCLYQSDRHYVVEAGAGIRFKQPVDPLGTLDRALAAVDRQRSILGAVQNRLESVISTQQRRATNLEAARSRIEDADYAVEVSKITASQIISQSATAMLAQANQRSQSVLALLGR